jgi:alkylated DNA repair dioxygenase AlkB
MQQTLFISPGVGPPGFRYHREFLTVNEETHLRDFFKSIEFRPFEFHGFTGNRRVASYGLSYDFGKHRVEPAAPFPELLESFVSRVAAFAEILPSDIVQIGVNEYRPGAGIGWHLDKPQFGSVIGISIGGFAKLRFRRRTTTKWERCNVILEPRSVYLLSGSSRSEWEHSIPAHDHLRYSVTFRTKSLSKARNRSILARIAPGEE